MTRRNLLTTAVLSSAALCLSLIARNGSAQTAESAQPGPFKPVMPLLSLMVEQDRHFDRIIELVRNTDEEERFEKMRHEAYALAEMGNINGYHRGAQRHEDYRQWAGQLRDLALQLAGDAERKSADGFADKAKQINATCKACHDKYK